MTSRASLAVLVLGLGVPTAVRASSPHSVFVSPSKVEMLPNEAQATRVLIHGAFTLLGSGGVYSEAKCGYMYFECPKGKETICRMAWQDVARTEKTLCAGFGTTDMITSASLRTAGTPVDRPDPWDIGMGVSPGSFVGGQCEKARMLVCSAPPVDAGAVDAPAGGGGGSGGGSGGATPKLNDGGGCAMAIDARGGGSLLALLGLGLIAAAVRRRRG